MKAATQMRELTVPLLKISIHAAREGGNHEGLKLFDYMLDFNPRRP